MLAITWAAYTVAIAPLMRRYSPYRISAVVLAIGWVPLALVSIPQLSQDFHFWRTVWLGFAYAVIGPLFLTNVLWFTAVDRVGAPRAAIFDNMQPFFGVFFALLILSEAIHGLEVVGGVLIFIGIAYERVWRRVPASVPTVSKSRARGIIGAWPKTSCRSRAGITSSSGWATQSRRRTSTSTPWASHARRTQVPRLESATARPTSSSRETSASSSRARCSEEHEITKHHARHGDGVRDIALTVPDATQAYQRGCLARRSKRAEPRRDEDEFGSVKRSAIATYGDTIHTFVNRADYAGPFLPGYVSVSENGHRDAGVGLLNLDHVVGNVELGKMDYWVEFYEQVFGMTNIIHFGDDDIQTEYSALMSKVMSDGSGKVKFPINEPAEGKRKSQIQEYLDFYGSAGAQHIALASTDIVATVEAMKERGFVFLDTPDSYYEEAPGRVGEIAEDFEVLQRHKILVDRDEDGYLLQIFTKTAQDRPTVFFEVIERHGATTFGEGNFKALFEAIEREQALRGNL